MNKRKFLIKVEANSLFEMKTTYFVRVILCYKGSTFSHFLFTIYFLYSLFRNNFSRIFHKFKIYFFEDKLIKITDKKKEFLYKYSSEIKTLQFILK